MEGEEQTVGGALQNLGPTPDRVLIGASRNGSVNSFNWKGLIDEVAICDHVLSPDRILAHYSAALPIPKLTINAAGEITWPTLPAGSILQETASLTEPVLWTADDSIPVATSGFFKVVVPLTGTN